MNYPLGQKNRPWHGRLSVVNLETSSQILTGMPVCSTINLGSEGFGVVLPSTAGAARANTTTEGIAVPSSGAADPGEWFDIIPVGWCNFTRLVRGTRAVTTDPWPTFPALGLGDICSINTVANAIAYSTTGAAYQAGPAIVCMGLTGQTATSDLTLASTTTAASNAYTAYSGQTAYTLGVRTWLRLL